MTAADRQRLINSLGRSLYARGNAQAEEIWDNTERAQAPGWRDKYLAMAEDILPTVQSEVERANRESADSADGAPLSRDEVKELDHVEVDDPSGGRTIMVRFSNDGWCGPRDLTSDLNGVMDGNPTRVILNGKAQV